MAKNVPRVLLMMDSPRMSGRSMLLGIAKYSRLHGPWLLLNESGRQDKTKRQIHKLDLNGIIASESLHIGEIAQLGIPLIVLPDEHYNIPNCYVIRVNNTLVGSMAAEYLIGLRLKSFAFCGFTDRHWSTERKIGFCDAVEKMGFKVEVYERHSTYLLSTITGEMKRLMRWLESLRKPVGILACVDDCGRHILDACRLAGIRVPDEVAVIGVDNDDLVCEITNPPLSSVELNFQTAGYDAARFLDELMNQEKPSSDYVMVQPTRVVQRYSTETIAIEDVDVVNAIRYIRQNFRYDIHVDSVSDAVMLSRRVLERRFRKYLSRSVLEEINHVRVSYAIQLLLETRMSIEKIAISSGFSSLKHFSRTFHKIKGITASQFRKQFLPM